MATQPQTLTPVDGKEEWPQVRGPTGVKQKTPREKLENAAYRRRLCSSTVEWLVSSSLLLSGCYLPDAMSSSWRPGQIISSNDRTFWGWMFVLAGSVFFVGYFFVAIVAKLLPPSNIAIISAMQNDWYYCFLVPLTLPILVVAVYFHWLSMKMFKHA